MQRQKSTPPRTLCEGGGGGGKSEKVNSTFLFIFFCSFALKTKKNKQWKEEELNFTTFFLPFKQSLMLILTRLKNFIIRHSSPIHQSAHYFPNKYQMTRNSLFSSFRACDVILLRERGASLKMKNEFFPARYNRLLNSPPGKLAVACETGYYRIVIVHNFIRYFHGWHSFLGLWRVS